MSDGNWVQTTDHLLTLAACLPAPFIVLWALVELRSFRPCRVCGAPYAGIHNLAKHAAKENVAV